jgi:hypothetical protein
LTAGGDAATIPLMKTKVRIFENGRGNADNVTVIDKMTLVVHKIDEPTNKVLFVVNPNIVEYHATTKSQRIEVQSIDETSREAMTPGHPPKEITIDGTDYQIAVDSFGTEKKDGRQWTYCDFSVSW